MTENEVAGGHDGFNGIQYNYLLGTATGGSIASYNGQCELRDSILSRSREITNDFYDNHNPPETNFANFRGTLIDLGNNISSDNSCNFTNSTSFNSTDPLLGPLTDNGGYTATMLLLPGSPAIDAGGLDSLPLIDQRGQIRPVGAASDIGAVEMSNEPGELTFAMTNYSGSITDGNVRVTVQRTVGYFGTVSVDFATADGTATAGSSYVATNGTLVFLDGETSKTFSVPILTNNSARSIETVMLTLSNPTGGATLGFASATLSITNPTPHGQISFLVDSLSAVEGDGVVVTVTRTNGDAGAMSVNFETADGTAVAGSDYVSTNGTLIFGEGETTKTFTVSTLSDAFAETNETVLLTLSSPAGGATLGITNATLSITENSPHGQLSFLTNTFSGEEGQNVSITVVRENGSAGTVSVDYETLVGAILFSRPATSSSTLSTNGLFITNIVILPPVNSSYPAGPGTDFIATNGTLVFAEGEVSKTFSITLLSDMTAEGMEFIPMRLIHPTGGAELGLSNAEVNIMDNSPRGELSWATNWFTASEGSTVTVSVSRTNGSAGTVYVDFATSDGTAQAGPDYVATNGTLTFIEGQTNASFEIALLNDSFLEANDTFQVNLTHPSSTTLTGDSNAVVTIIDASPRGEFAFLTNAWSVGEGDTATITVIRRNGSAGIVSVDYSMSDGAASAGSDYEAQSGTLVFTEGETSKTFTVSTTADSTSEANESIQLSLSNPLGGATLGGNSAVLTVIDSRPASGDLIFQHTDGRLSFWAMKGTNFLFSKSLRTSAKGWKITGVGDLSGDGKADFVFQNQAGGLAVWKMNGSSFLSSFGYTNKLATGWRSVGIADFNNDNNLDLPLQHQNGAVALWSMNGTNKIGYTMLRLGNPTLKQRKVVAAADLDNDGKTDILLQDTLGRLGCWRMNGTNIIGWLQPRNGTPPAKGLRVAGVHDFNGDGKADILFQHANGQISVWFMDGTRFLRSAFLRNGIPAVSGWRVVGIVP